MKPAPSITLIVFFCACAVADETQRPVETFYQNIDIQRHPRFATGGLQVNQQIHYQIQSSFELYAADEEGIQKVVQTVTETNLVKADPLSQAAFATALADLQGKRFTYQVRDDGTIVSMQGHKGNTKAVKVAPPQTQGVLVSTVIDEDGWKELAQLTLFQPPADRRRARSFVRKTTHDWGPLGSWYGDTNFTGRDFGREGRRFGYLHQLQYIPPNKATAKPHDLPFQIEGARFRMYEGGGEIQYSDRTNRVTRVHEVFDARGTVASTMLGVPSTVDVAESQVFNITITGQRRIGPQQSAVAGDRGETERQQRQRPRNNER